LTEASFVPVRARSSREAINLARTLRPAAITLDIILPGADGWEVLKTLKGDADTADIPVIIVSVVDNRELGMALGAQDYLLKPVDGSLLVRRLRELLPRPSGEKQRILLIDDDPTLHEIMEEKLKSSGFIMDHAMSGREGIELVRRQPPVLIVLDLMMQEMDGFEVAKVLREDPATAQIPIVVFTAKDVNAGDKERLAGKVAALVEKGRTSHSGIVPIIRDVLNRQTAEARRG
jgi:CheY-like chemotaxis protein